MKYKVELWAAINDYVVACGGDPAARVYGNVARMDAVVQVETWVERECASRGGIREYRRPAVSVLVSEAAKVGTVVGLSDGMPGIMGLLLGDAPEFPGNVPDPTRMFVLKNVGVVEEPFDDHDPFPFDGGGKETP
jgi:hypothetical protein